MSEQTENQNDLGEAINLLEGMLDRMGIDATVEGDDTDDKLLLRIECEEEEQTQRIIGRRGQVVDAFQHLLNKMLHRDREERGKPVIVDAGGYRERHVERLEGLADRSAEKARESGEAVDLNPMSAYDRRIVHMRLAEIEGVTTQSEGEGDSRHIVVLPE
jgi:spoIIIJ-associated protein